MIVMAVFATLLLLGFLGRGDKIGDLECDLWIEQDKVSSLKSQLAAAIKERDEARADRDDADKWARAYHEMLLNALGIKTRPAETCGEGEGE